MLNSAGHVRFLVCFSVSVFTSVESFRPRSEPWWAVRRKATSVRSRRPQRQHAGRPRVQSDHIYCSEAFSEVNTSQSFIFFITTSASHRQLWETSCCDASIIYVHRIAQLMIVSKQVFKLLLFHLHPKLTLLVACWVAQTRWMFWRGLIMLSCMFCFLFWLDYSMTSQHSMHVQKQPEKHPIVSWEMCQPVNHTITIATITWEGLLCECDKISRRSSCWTLQLSSAPVTDAL